MLEYYITDSNNKLQKIDQLEKGCWVNVVAPSEEEIQRISKRLNIPEDFIKDPLDDEERSRLEKEDNLLLIIVDFPYIIYDDAGFPLYETLPIGLIVTEECFITISLRETPILKDFVANKIKGFFTYKKTRFALQILFNISTCIFNNNILKQIFIFFVHFQMIKSE